MKIVTYNLRCVYDRDGINSFVHRAVIIRDKINAEKPDVIAFQEITPGNLEVMKLLLPDYSFAGIFRSKNFDGEGLYTAVRNESCELIGVESVWLSPTPHVPGSRFEEQSDCPRVCVETEVLHKATKKRIRLFNIHLDHISESARVLGIKAVFEFAEKFGREIPRVFLGDLNAEPTDEAVVYCEKQDGLADLTKNIKITFHDFGRRSLKIDYIFADKCLADLVTEVSPWDDCKNGVYLSDHYPICAALDI